MVFVNIKQDTVSVLQDTWDTSVWNPVLVEPMAGDVWEGKAGIFIFLKLFPPLEKYSLFFMFFLCCVLGF